MRNFGFVFLLVFFSNCTPHESPNESFKEGDILFQDLNCGPLCEAIEKVTQGVNGRDFSHCGVIFISEEDSVFVIEAIGEAVVMTPLADFLARSGDIDSLVNVVVGRPKSKVELSAALNYLRSKLGVKYDDAFLPNNGKYYCSELIAEAYLDSVGNRVFKNAPMTFVDPSTGMFFPAWVEYYSELGIAIPEGELGINPGLISRSDEIEIIKVRIN